MLILLLSRCKLCFQLGAIIKDFDNLFLDG
jgi:hypothetical protein